MDRRLGGSFGSERFSKDEKFLLMMGVQSTLCTMGNRGVSLHSPLWVIRGVSLLKTSKTI